MSNNTPTRKEAEDAVKTLIRWAGDNPEREGLSETPKRVVDSYKTFFKGYHEDPATILDKTFDEIDEFNDIVMLKGIKFISFCEHHVLPIIGYADIAYLPHKRVVGISKIARVVDAFAHRLQIQERLTSQIANSLNKWLQPKGVAVSISAYHQCMTIRGVNKSEAEMQTSHMIGAFQENINLKSQFFNYIAQRMNKLGV